jgi:hypothetical protein
MAFFFGSLAGAGQIRAPRASEISLVSLTCLFNVRQPAGTAPPGRKNFPVMADYRQPLPVRRRPMQCSATGVRRFLAPTMPCLCPCIRRRVCRSHTVT